MLVRHFHSKDDFKEQTYDHQTEDYSLSSADHATELGDA